MLSLEELSGLLWFTTANLESCGKKMSGLWDIYKLQNDELGVMEEEQQGVVIPQNIFNGQSSVLRFLIFCGWFH